MTSLQQAVVTVTGANGGLGAHFVRQALERGASRVYATARRPRDWDDARVVPLELDVTDRASVAAAARTAADTTVLVNNAGIASAAPTLFETDPDEVRALFDTNVLGLLEVTRAFAPALVAHGGALVDVASIASWRSRRGLAAYAATKAAVWSLDQGFRDLLGPQGVQVLGVFLAFSDTPMTAQVQGPKSDPADVVRQVWEGLEAGALEVLADDRTREVRARLADPVTA